MVGVCGVFGNDRPGVDPVSTWLYRDGEGVVTEHDEAGLTGVVATHRGSAQPISVPERDATLLVFGTVYSRNRAGSWDRRPAGVSTPAYCARQFGADGIDALTELNGEFVAVVLDHEARTLRLVTDLLGSHPVYYHLGEEWLLFSTSAQSLVHHPDVPAAFDPEFLVEYLARKSVRGVETPFAGIGQLPPASVTTIDFSESEPIAHDRYWQPIERPTARPIDRFVDLFIDRFHAALEDRLRSDRRHGLLLSGGSDSRLLAATVDPDVAYGFNTSPAASADESTVAARVAETADVPFTRFELGPDHYAEFLEGYARHGNAIGWFNEGRTLAVADEMREEVDALVSGLYADVFFKGWTLPTRQLSTPAGGVSLPLERRVENRQEYLETRSAATPAYVDADDVSPADRTLARELVATGDGVRDHGIEYPSVADLTRTGFWFPLTNETSFDRYADAQVLPTVYPFLDRRLIELSLELPRADAMRYNIVNRVVSRLAPDLASIPHNRTGVALSKPRLVHWLGQLYDDRVRDVPGGTNAEALRQGWLPGFVREHEPTIRALPGVEYETVERLCREHHEGGDHTAVLCGLVSVLAMPATATITGTEPAIDEATPTAR